MTARHVVVRGRVQGVFYRDWTVSSARQLGVTGWVRNLTDGTVEAHLEGTSSAVERLIAQMHVGPSAARVERIEQTEVPMKGFDGFARR